MTESAWHGSPWRRSWLAAALLAGLVLGCEGEHWRGTHLRATEEDVAAALGDTSHQHGVELPGREVPDIPYARSLRPCCLFGHDLRVKVAGLTVPGVEIGNVLGLADVGPHRYDNGFLSISSSDPRGFVDDERNGLLYTCRGGFVDTAHVRDNADNTLALSFAVARNIYQGATIDVPPQGAAMRVRLRALPPDTIERYGWLRLSVALAQWIAYQLSIWHEIATWYGFASVSGFPEKNSSFSPEDLYSNQLGARISGAIILSGGARSDTEYNLNVDAWIAQVLKRLRVVSLRDAQAAVQELDGTWWDSARAVPDWMMVRHRRTDTGPLLQPWTLEMASPGPKGPGKPLPACRDAGRPLVLRVEDGWNGVTFRDYATVEFEVGDAMAAEGFPFPRPGTRRVNQDDFPAVVSVIRRENAKVFGDAADRP
jgi:hypothetical protein